MAVSAHQLARRRSISVTTVEGLVLRDSAAERRPWIGYLLVGAAAMLLAVNGSVSKVILASGLSSLRLTEARLTGAALGLLAVLATTRRGSLRIRARELPFLLAFGVFGVALVQWFYFLAIHRLDVGIALLIQYLAPVLVALWARFALRQPVRRRVWAALALALAGLALVAEVWHRGALDGGGVAAALAAALTFATYILLAEHAVGSRDPLSLTCYGFLFGALAWAFIQPWWSFPAESLDDRVSLLGNLEAFELPTWLLIAWVVVLGTIIPFTLFVSALRHIPATRAGIVAMLEPVVAAAVAWAWLGESLGAAQLVGGSIVLAGIVLGQTARG